jgi:tRNA(Arg) A34 adenosine deaminase TadA
MCRFDERAVMRLAIQEAIAGVNSGQAPFGCVLVKDGEVIAQSHNTVWQDTDPTKHAEINAIQIACARLQTIDLSGVEMFCTCEPCPMCYSAAHWARISRIVFGARIEDARNAGFNELPIPAQEMNRFNPRPMEIVAGFMADECRAVFELWKRQGRSRPY